MRLARCVVWPGARVEADETLVGDAPASARAGRRQRLFVCHAEDGAVMTVGGDQAFLGSMNEAWFQKTIIRKPSPKK